MTQHCPAKDNPNSIWPAFCPNFGASVFYVILFSLTLTAHIAQGIIYRKGYSWVVAMSAMWQVLAYIFHSISIKNVTNEGVYIPWFVLMLLAPILLNAYVYMVIGRMTYNFTKSAKIFGFKAWRLTLCFVIADCFCFVVQAAGASSASGNNLTNAQILRGLHIYMGGVGLQQFLILCFCFLAWNLRQQMKRDLPASALAEPLRLFNIIIVVLIFISIRIIFRLIEYSKGYDSYIIHHEAFQYIFDSTVMLIALVLLNVFHPGKFMPGKECDFPSRKERKSMGKDHQWGRASHFGDDSRAQSINLVHAQPKVQDV